MIDKNKIIRLHNIFEVSNAFADGYEFDTELTIGDLKEYATTVNGSLSYLSLLSKQLQDLDISSIENDPLFNNNPLGANIAKTILRNRATSYVSIAFSIHRELPALILENIKSKLISKGLDADLVKDISVNRDMTGFIENDGHKNQILQYELRRLKVTNLYAL